MVVRERERECMIVEKKKQDSSHSLASSCDLCIMFIMVITWLRIENLSKSCIFASNCLSKWNKGQKIQPDFQKWQPRWQTLYTGFSFRGGRQLKNWLFRFLSYLVCICCKNQLKKCTGFLECDWTLTVFASRQSRMYRAWGIGLVYVFSCTCAAG